MRHLFLLFISLSVFFTISISQDNYSATYEAGPSMQVYRMGHFSATLSNGSVILVGGHGTNFVSLNTLEVYNPHANECTVHTMNYIHDFGAVCRLTDSSWLIAGGALDLGVAPGTNTAEIYFSGSNTFVPTGTMNYQRCGNTGILLGNGKVLIAGGWYSEGSATYTEIYDPTTQSFTPAAALNTPRSYPVLIPTHDSGAVVVGGLPIYGGTFYERVEYYNPSTNSFSVLSEQLIPTESGWSTYFSAYNRPIEEQMTSDGKFLLGVWRTTDLGTEYGLMTFNPATKEFQQLALAEPLPLSNVISFIGAPLVEKEKNLAYWFGVRPTSSVPWQIELCVIDLSSLRWTLATPSYSAPYYWGSVGINRTLNGKILISGGTNRTDYYYNFYPVNNTMLVTPSKISAVADGNGSPATYTLHTNYPNPFNPATTISFTLPSHSFVSLKIYDLNGKEVATIVSGELPEGEHAFRWDASGMSSGVYYYRLVTERSVETKKMVLLR